MKENSSIKRKRAIGNTFTYIALVLISIIWLLTVNGSGPVPPWNAM